jgi:auxin efflux carrier family
MYVDVPDSPVKDVEAADAAAASAATVVVVPVKPSLWALVKVVAHKLSRNPNTYASFVGITWACVANRYLRIACLYATYIRSACSFGR